MQIEKLTTDIEGVIDRAAVTVAEVHKKIAKVPFDLAAQIGPIAETAHKVHASQDHVLDIIYDSIRKVNHALFEGLTTMTRIAAPAEPAIVTPSEPVAPPDPTHARRKKAVETTVKA